jgi:type IV pilus assembly protein PilX
VNPKLVIKRKNQRGVTLVVVLLLLLVVTILGLTAMRGTVMQERLSGNSASRAEAFQWAEGALREVEADLAEDSDRPDMPGAGCSSGYCAMVTGGDPSTWEATGFWTTAGGYATADIQANAVAERPGTLVRYVVEDMGDGRGESEGCPGEEDMAAPACTAAGTAVRNYRITVFSQMPNGAQVLLQSTFQRP